MLKCRTIKIIPLFLAFNLRAQSIHSILYLSDSYTKFRRIQPRILITGSRVEENGSREPRSVNRLSTRLEVVRDACSQTRYCARIFIRGLESISIVSEYLWQVFVIRTKFACLSRLSFSHSISPPLSLGIVRNSIFLKIIYYFLQMKTT